MMLLFCICANIGYAQASDFVTKWDLSKPPYSLPNNTIDFYTTNAAGSVAYTWQELSPGSSSGSGSFAAGTEQLRTISGLPAGATIELRLAPTNLQRFYNYGNDARLRLVDITQWGSTVWTSMENMFHDCESLQNISSTDLPNLTNVSNMSNMFYSVDGLNGPTNIGDWNTANVTNMDAMFRYCSVFNQDIGNWNTANVTSMYGMFEEAYAFNQNIGNWNTAKVTTMSSMFYYASAFNQNIGAWNTANVIDMSYMFIGASAFNQNIGAWNTANVIGMSNMFWYATAFNQNIGNWNTAKVTDMSYMFSSATAFNQNIGAWNTANVTRMSSMFSSATAFNQNIGAWNTANVTNMEAMFSSATAFDQNIGAWNTANVTNMSSMFSSATAFNQNLGNWVLNASVTMASMLNSCGMDCDNYSRTLAGWALTTSATGRSLGATGRTYGTNVSSLRSLLTTSTGLGGKGWTIAGDAASGTCGPTVFYSKSTGNLDDVANWGTNTNGTGTPPTDFTDPDQYFAIRNRSTASLSGNWSTTGANSLVILGDGTNAITFTTGTNTIAGACKLANNSTLELGSNSTGLSFACENGSTVTYNGSGAQTIAPGNYHTLNISGNRGGNGLTLASGLITARNTAVISASNVSSWINTGNTFTYGGTGAETIAPIDYNNLVIGGARTGSPTITLGSGTIRIAGNAILNVAGVGSWITTNNTIEYNGSGAQTIQAAPFTYNNLTISGARTGSPAITLQSGTINIAGDATFSATGVGSWINTGNTINYNGTAAQQIGAFNYNDLTSSSSGARTLQASGTIGVAGTFTPGTNSYTTTGSTINFNGPAAQSINAFNYNNLASSNSGGRTLASTGSIGVAGTFTPGTNTYTTTGSTINFNGAGAQTINDFNYNNLTSSNSGGRTLASTGSIGVAGTFTPGTNTYTTTGSTINFNGAGAQTIPVFNYNNLTIAGSSNKTLGGNVIVGGDLTLSNKLILGANNLTLSGSINGGSSSNYLQTNSTGTLKKNLSNTAAFTFTVGNSAYNPVTITNNTGTADLFSVRVQDAVYNNGVSGTSVSTARVNRTWQIDKSNPTANAGSGVNFTFQWNSGEEVGGTPAMQINHHNGSSWAAISGLYTAGSGYPMTLSYSGYKGSFSPFAIGDDIVLLPVSWLYMHCNNTKPGTNTIQWATASQTNSRSFVVERSSNGKTFVALDSLAAAGNSHNANHYSYVDEHADLPEAYYRIKQVDENGSEHLSEICLVQTKSSKDSPMVSLYPNPAASAVFLSAGEKSLPYNWALYNATGQLMASGISDGGQASINLSNIGKGIYNLHVQGEGFLQNVKLLVNP